MSNELSFTDVVALYTVLIVTLGTVSNLKEQLDDDSKLKFASEMVTDPFGAIRRWIYENDRSGECKIWDQVDGRYYDLSDIHEYVTEICYGKNDGEGGLIHFMNENLENVGLTKDF